MPKNIRVAIKNPGKVLVLETIPNTLKAFQQAVDGPIELIRPLWSSAADLDVFVNENGGILAIPPPQQVMPWTLSQPALTVHGPILIVHRADDAGNHTLDLTDDQVHALKKIFRRPT